MTRRMSSSSSSSSLFLHSPQPAAFPPVTLPPQHQPPAPSSPPSPPTPVPAGAAPPAPRRPGLLLRVSRSIDGRMRRFFFVLGHFVARRPLAVIAASLLLTALALVGMLRFRTESRATRLWIPTGSLALANQAFANAAYGRSDRVSVLAFTPSDAGDAGGSLHGLATVAALSEVAALAEAALNVSAVAEDVPTENGTTSSVTVTWRQRCVTTVDTRGISYCRSFSVLDLFYNDSRAVVRFPDGSLNFFASVREHLKSLSDADVRAALARPPSMRFDDAPFNADQLFAVRAPGAAASAIDVRVVSVYQSIRNTAVERDGELLDPVSDALEEAWASIVLGRGGGGGGGPQLSLTEAFASSAWLQQESLRDAISSDLPLLSIGLVLLAAYVIVFLGDLHVVRSHMWLGVGALLTNGLAIGTCFGLSSLCGMFFGPVHQILPLLIVGIGIDDCFHITRAADDTTARPDLATKPLEKQIALALSTAGSAITVTSFTNVVVFLFSSVSRLPALRFFSLWAAIGIFFAWVYAVTFYTALITLDARRIRARRRDCMPCCMVAEVRENNWLGRPRGGFSRFFGEQYGPLLLRSPVRAVVLFLFAAWLAVSIYACTKLAIKARRALFYPTGTPQRDYEDLVDRWYSLGQVTNVYLRNTTLRSVSNRDKLLRLCDPRDGAVAKNEWVLPDSVDCWYAAFRAQNNLPDGEFLFADMFMERAAEFLSSEAGARYSRSVIFNAERKDIVSTRFEAKYKFRETNQDETEALKSLRRSIDSVGFPRIDGMRTAFPYNFRDTITEANSALPGEIGLSLGLACLAVALVCFLLVGHPVVALLSLLVVGFIIIDVLGLTYLSGVQLNSVSVITLVLCVGISVDFVVHIARMFLEFVGDRRERAVMALRTMGPPVFYAGMSTLLAIIVLVGAKSYGFQVFFRGFVFLLSMAFIHGLILLPVLLSLVGPPSFYANEEEKLYAERQLEKSIESDVSSDETL